MNQDKFFWARIGDYTHFLPIDYSQKEMAEVFKLNRISLRKYIIKNKKFKALFDWARMPSEKESKTRNDTNGIPAELASYFRLYLETQTTSRSSDSKVSSAEDFIKKLYQCSIEAEENPEMSGERYWTRVLYENREFQSALLKKYWEEVLQKRFLIIHDHLQQCPSKLQIEILKNLILVMDDCLEQICNSEPDGAVRSDFETEYPIQLLKKTRGSANAENKIQVPQITFESKDMIENGISRTIARQLKTMEDAFLKISRNQAETSKIRTYTRKKYLDALNQNTGGKSQFQTDYERLYEYALNPLDPFSPEEIKKTINNRCVAKFMPLLYRIRILPGFSSPESLQYTNKNEENAFIEYEISRRYNLFYSQYEQVFTFILTDEKEADTLRQIAVVRAQRFQLQPHVFIDEYYNRLKLLLPESMNYILDKQCKIDLNDLTQKISAELEKASLNLFGVKNDYDFSVYILSALQHISEYNKGIVSFYQPAGYRSEDIIFTVILFIICINEKIADVSNSVYGEYMRLSSFLRETNGESF